MWDPDRMQPDRQRISQGSEFERRIGYSRAIVDGRWVFVAGTTGFDYTTMTISDDVVAQVEQTLRNIDDALDACRLVCRRRRAGEVPPARCRRLRGVLARPARVLRRSAAGGDDDGRRAVRSPHAHRDRGHGAQTRVMSPTPGIDRSVERVLRIRPWGICSPRTPRLSRTRPQSSTTARVVMSAR